MFKAAVAVNIGGDVINEAELNHAMSRLDVPGNGGSALVRGKVLETLIASIWSAMQPRTPNWTWNRKDLLDTEVKKLRHSAKTEYGEGFSPTAFNKQVGKSASHPSTP